MKSIKNVPASIRQRLLSRQFDFDGAVLTEAIRLTFERRGTMLPIEIKVFNKAFIDGKQVQWTAFWKRLQQDHVPDSFRDIVPAVEGFLGPIANALVNGKSKPTIWRAPGPWHVDENTMRT